MIEVEMQQIENIDPVSRTIVRHADWFINFSSIVTIAINCILLFFSTGTRITSENDFEAGISRIHPTIKFSLLLCNIVQLCSLGVAMYAFLIKKMPAIVANAERENLLARRQHNKIGQSPQSVALLGQGSVSGARLSKVTHDGVLKRVKPLSVFQKWGYVLRSPQFSYMVLMSLCAVGAVFQPFFSVFLLIGVLVRIHKSYQLMCTVVNIGTQAFLVLLMSVVTTYCHALLVFLYMNGKMFWNGEMPCDRLYKCVITGVWQGMTHVGGLGDIMLLASHFKDEATFGMLFNVFFFMVVSLMQQSLIVAMVARSFSDLRSKSRKQQDLEMYKCFICGMDRKQFSSVEEFHEHRNTLHDPWKYMKLRIYLQEKMRNARHELTGIEVHISEKLLLKMSDSTSPEDDLKLEANQFMPIRAQGSRLISAEHNIGPKSVTDTLGAPGLMSLVNGVSRQADVLRVMRMDVQ